MDMVDIAAAAEEVISQLSENGQIGKSSKRTITYDGNGTRVPVPGEDITVVKVLDEAIDLGGVDSLEIGGEPIPVENLTLTSISGAEVLLMGFLPCIISNSSNSMGDDYVGTFVIDHEEGEAEATERIYVSGFTYEVVKPADPKYTPGVLPVVKLTTTLRYGASTELSESDAEAMTAAANSGMPCIIKAIATMVENTDSGTTEETSIAFSGVALRAASMGGIFFMVNIGIGGIQFTFDGSSWSGVID